MTASPPTGLVLIPVYLKALCLALYFFKFISTLSITSSRNCLLYADDTSFFDVVDDPTVSAVKLNSDLEQICDWAKRWLVTINASKTKCMTFSVKRFKPFHPFHPLERLYKSLVCPVLKYADVVCDGCTESECDLLEHVQYEAAKIVTGAIKGISKHRLVLELGWQEVRSRRAVHKVILYYKIANNFCPNYLKNLLSLQVSERTSYSLRNLKHFTLFASRTERFNKSFFPSTTRLWNNLSIDVRSTLSLSVFKKSLLSYFSFPAKNVLYEVALDRFSSIIRTRLRLDACALNYYLFKIGRKESPACFCGFYSESVKHFFLKCHLFAASPYKLLSSAAQIFADRWAHVSDTAILSAFLSGCPSLSYDENKALFLLVQTFILDSNRFYVT